MKSFIALLAVAALACAIAVPASAMRTDAGPRVVAHMRHAAPVALSLGAGGFLSARPVTRRLSPRAS
jgi:hypothetical protein